MVLLDRIQSSSGSFKHFQQLVDAIKAKVVEESESAASEPEEAMVMLNLMYCQRRSKFYSLVQTLARIENLSYIVAWTKQSSLQDMVKRKLTADSLLIGCPHIDLIELPRIKLTLFTKRDHSGVLRLSVPLLHVLKTLPGFSW